MSMHSHELEPIPEETARVVRAACPKGTLAMWLRDELGAVYQDEQFAALDPVEGELGYAPWRLAVVTMLQYAENLTDRQAANAVRERLDWKYGLGLELDDPGFDFSLLSEFRRRLVDKGAEMLLLDRLLEVCQQRGWLKARGKQRVDSTHVLARVRSLSNLEYVGETLRAPCGELSFAQGRKPADSFGPANRSRWAASVAGTRASGCACPTEANCQCAGTPAGLAAVLRPRGWESEVASRLISQRE